MAQERLRWVTEQATALQVEMGGRAEADAALHLRLTAARDEVAMRQRAADEAEAQIRQLRGEEPLEEGPEGGKLDPAQARVRFERVHAELAASEARLAQGREMLEKLRLEMEGARQRLDRARSAWQEQKHASSAAEAAVARGETIRLAAQQSESTAAAEAAAAQRTMESHLAHLAELRSKAAAG